jgi:epoxyqueuosine reductase
MIKLKAYGKSSFIRDIDGMKIIFQLDRQKQPRLNTAVNFKEKPIFDEAWFIKTIKEKVVNHPANNMLYPFKGEKVFGEPIIGFVRGDDPIFQEYKNIIGPFHLTPKEVLAWQAKNNNVQAPKSENISVISYIMPVESRIKDDNAKNSDWPSARWAHVKHQSEILSAQFVNEIVTELMDNGILAVNPDKTPLFKFKRFNNTGWASQWSQRHIAYAAGLGTFGLNDFLITEKGTAHRCGSFVVNLNLKPNRQRPNDIHAFCLHYQKGKCDKCITRCPVNAISESGHNKDKCYSFNKQSLGYIIKHYHIFMNGCGLCATGVPCESTIPVKPTSL